MVSVISDCRIGLIKFKGEGPMSYRNPPHPKQVVKKKLGHHVNVNVNVNLIAAFVIALSPIHITPPECVAVAVAEIERGSSLFRQSCIGCHDAGGNIIQPGATLFSSDLVRNGADSEEEIYRITYNGKGRMPGFGEDCKPRGQCTFGPRLQDEDIRLLAKYVKLQADGGWPNP